MKKKKLIWINAFILGFSVLVATSCIKQNDPSPNIPEEISPIVFNPNLTYGTVSDIDSNVYKTITIGTQTWMAQNLNTTHYQNGDSIINANTNAKWNIAGPAFVKYPYSKASNWDSIYGKLYNGYAVIDTRNICPTGWHVPTDAEWKILYNYLGGEAIAVGQKIQETGTTHWKTEYGISTGVTNESGFTALPGGTRGLSNGVEFVGQKGWASWWSSTEMHNAEDEIIDWDLTSYDSLPQVNTGVWMSDGFHGGSKAVGCSVRCIKN